MAQCRSEPDAEQAAVIGARPVGAVIGREKDDAVCQAYRGGAFAATDRSHRVRVRRKKGAIRPLSFDATGYQSNRPKVA